MKPSEIRKVAAKRPFHPFEIRLVDGDRHVIHHPETILVGEDLVVALDPEGQTILMAPEAVVSIRKVPSSPRKR